MAPTKASRHIRIIVGAVVVMIPLCYSLMRRATDRDTSSQAECMLNVANSPPSDGRERSPAELLQLLDACKRQAE